MIWGAVWVKNQNKIGHQKARIFTYIHPDIYIYPPDIYIYPPDIYIYLSDIYIYNGHMTI